MIKAKFICHIYNNIEKGYSINSYEVVEGDERCKPGYKIVGTGYYLSNYKDIVCELEGEWVTHKQYGDQYKISSCTEILQSSETGVKAFLASGMIKGVGEKTAEGIYAAFKETTFEIVEHDYEKLAKVKGVSKSKAKKIHESFMENKYAKEIIGMLVPVGFTSKLAMKVYRLYGDEAVKIIQHKPYDLCKIKGFGFKTVDKMAIISHVSKTSPDRIKACVFYVLQEALAKGNLYMELPELRKEVVVALNTPNITEQLVHNIIVELITNKKVTLFRYENEDGKRIDCIYIPALFKVETEVAQHLTRLYSVKSNITFDVVKAINEAEKELGVSLDILQKIAIYRALTENVMVITGGPGTGKTTVLKVFDYIVRKYMPEKSILYCSPTGRAARRMSESTGHDAITVHKAIGFRGNDNEESEEEFEGEEIGEDIIVVDEVSMLDIFIARMLFKAITSGKKLVLVGDAEQLPSVGPGLVLHSIIKSNVIPVVELQKIYRQNEDSSIYTNIKRIKDGKTKLVYSSDFKLYPADSLNVVEDVAVKLYEEEVKKYGLENVAYITPFRDKAAGLNAMNVRLQEIINPKDAKKPEYVYKNTTFRTGDIVMELKNRDEVSNGDIGTIQSIYKTDDDVIITVRFFDSIDIEYDSETIEELTLAYAITVHKSQGSEYKAVITCLTMAHMVFLKRNMPYTAFSRGKEDVSFIGSEKALAIAIRKKETEIRNTTLDYKIRQYSKYYNCKEIEPIDETVFSGTSKSTIINLDSHYEQMSLNEVIFA